MMSYTDSQLKDEISRFVVMLIETQGDDSEISPDWVSLGVIADNVSDFRRGSDFTANAVWGHVRKMVGAYLRSMRLKEDDGLIEQGILAGFEMLQRYYEVERSVGNTVKIVRVKRSEMTVSERRAEAELRRRVGMANLHHGDALDRETDELIAAGMLEGNEE